MGILDQLIEKKDLKCYIRARKAILRDELTRVVKSMPVDKRELKIRLIKGRLMELSKLWQIVHEKKAKDWAIKHWRKAMYAERRLGIEDEQDSEKVEMLK